MLNGVLFQKRKNTIYQGVEGDNWYLNDMYDDSLGIYFSNRIEKAWYDKDYVDVASEMDFIKEYVRLSRENRVNFRIILCETEKHFPTFAEDNLRVKEILGYDYAYSGGSYYSAINNELCLRKMVEFKAYKLNSNGLFQTYDEIMQFIRDRNNYLKSGINIEKGDFVIYKLSEIELL